MDGWMMSSRHVHNLEPQTLDLGTHRHSVTSFVLVVTANKQPQGLTDTCC
jgi:hypothetical protein